MYLSPTTDRVQVGDTFSLSINLDTQDVSVNAVSTDIRFDNSKLAVQSVGKTNSILSIWTEDPSYSNTRGLAHLSGGIYSPGWNGSQGTILMITFKAKASGKTKISFENGSALANDGIGTEVLGMTSGADIEIAPSRAVTPAVPTKIPVIATTTIATSTPIVVVVEQEPYTMPILINIPEQLTDGSVLAFDGLAIHGGATQVYIQKGHNNPEITEVRVRADNTFNIVYNKKVVSGYYKIWARNILSSGMIGASSDISYVEVLPVNGVTLIGYEIPYRWLISALVLVIMLLVVILGVVSSLYIHRRHKKKGK